MPIIANRVNLVRAQSRDARAFAEIQNLLYIHFQSRWLEDSDLAKRTHSALKSARQAVRRRVRNRIITSSARTYVKQANALVASGDLSAAEKATRSAVIALDRAAQKGILKKNNAARRKSRLLLKLNALRAAKK